MSARDISLWIYLLMPLHLGLAQAQQDPCDCKGTNQATRYRTKTKHIKTYSRYPKSKLVITPTTVVSWQEIYDNKTSEIGRDNASKKLGKVKGTPEDKLYTLEGYLYFIKMEDDCDYHMDIGSDDPDETRAVVKLTKEFCSQQRHVFEFIQDNLKENDGVTVEFKNGFSNRKEIS